MFKSHSRDKLIHAVIFFAQNTRWAEKRKVMGLLYMLDFGHFTQTGHSVTGLEYAAWAQGPVPIDFFAEWDEPRPDLSAAIGHTWERQGHSVLLKKAFDPQWFSKREIRLMSELAKQYADASPEDVERETKNAPWQTAWDQGSQVIDYALAIPKSDPRRDELLSSAREYAATMLGISKRPIMYRHIA